MNTRTYWSVYQTRTRLDLFIFIQKVFYCDLLQIIIKDIENEKVRYFFQNSWLNDLIVSGFEVIALDDGIFPRSMVEKLAFIYISYS